MAPVVTEVEFWRQDTIADALVSRHFGRLFRAYRHAHDPVMTQADLGQHLGLSQAQVSRLEKANVPPSDLEKLIRWANVLCIPSALLWFQTVHTPEESAETVPAPSLDDVDRRNLIRLTGALVGAGVLDNSPWQRLAETLGGRRAADASTVAMIENRTAEFFRTEETMPARQMVSSLLEHHRALKGLIEATPDERLRRRLIIVAGETEALTGWTLFDLQRPREAVQLYRQALDSAREAGDRPLAACVLAYWSYLLSSQDKTREAVRMLTDAAEHIRGSAATTQAWIQARRAEEQGALGDTDGALRSLDGAVTVFDSANPANERPWTSFFTPTRLGSLAVSTYGRIAHPETDNAASSLLAAMSPSENKVKALVLADLATSAIHGGDYDRVRSLANESADIATRAEASLAIDRLWDIVEKLPTDRSVAGQTRTGLTERLMNKTTA